MIFFMMKKMFFLIFAFLIFTTSFNYLLANDDSTPRYRIDSITFEYTEKNNNLPSLDKLYNKKIFLKKLSNGYDFTTDDQDKISLKIKDIDSLSLNIFSKNVLKQIAFLTLNFLKERGLDGIIVSLDPNQIDEDGKDLRDNYNLRFIIILTKIVRVETYSSGKRFVGEEINNWQHDHIIQNSPISSYSDKQLLKREKLDEYVRKLNKHPQRKVQALITEDEKSDDLILKFLVSEEKPWIAYSSIMNTGTQSTKRINELFGVVNTQFTNHNDILSCNYFTAGFEEIHAVFLSYLYPLPKDFFIKVSGIYNDYNASNFALLSFGRQYKSTEKSLILEAGVNVYQKRDLFLDVFWLMRYRDIKVVNYLAQTKEKSDFLLPFFGLYLEKINDNIILKADASFGGNLGPLIDTEKSKYLSRFGRADVNRNWIIAYWNFYTSFYLDKLYKYNNFCPHEAVFAFSGQYAFNYRVIPQERAVYGGMYTVRGYPESIAAGDNAMLFTFQYEYHLARLITNLKKENMLPIWDLIPLGFIDYGNLVNNRKKSYEKNYDLLGIGFGGELRIKTNILVRAELGFAMKKFSDPLEPNYVVNKGHKRFHFLTTLLY